MSTKSNELAMSFAIFEREHGLTASNLLLPHKVSLNQMSIVSHLSRNTALTISDLSKLTVSDKSSTSRTLAGLEKLGWIKKVAGKDDRRKSFIQLTAKGRKQAKIADKICDSLSDTMELAITSQERIQLVSLLGKIVGSLIERRKK
jgi:DNA-binding MarR family transcriptional regulator